MNGDGVGRARATVLVALLLALPAAARAHVVYGTPSLHELVRDADAVVRVQITAASRVMALDDGHTRPVVEARVLETLHGPPMRAVTFAPHGHGPATYHDGAEAIVVLRRIERVPELASTPLAARVRWASLQETTDALPLTRRTRAVWVDAVRRYLAVEAEGAPAARLAALRALTLGLLASPEPRLAAAALRDVVRAGDASLLTGADVPRLDALLARAETPVAVRVGLLAELERRGLVEAPPRWAALLERTRGGDRLVVLRAAGAHPSPATRAVLLRIAGEDGAEAAAAAAVALGVPGDTIAVEPLARLLARDDARLRLAAIRGLGGIGGDEAARALEQAAAFHPDAATRRRATAELRLLGSAAR